VKFAAVYHVHLIDSYGSTVLANQRYISHSNFYAAIGL